MTFPRVLGLAGHSGSGKTSLAEQLVPALAARGLSVAYLKHDAHRFQMDKPGKDTFRVYQAGAVAVAIASAEQWAWLQRPPIPDIETLVRRARRAADVVLIEGYHHSAYPKVLVYRRGLPLRTVRPWSMVLALYGDDPRRLRQRPPARIPRFPFDRTADLVEFLFGRPAAAAGR
ncbi:MAG: molybdopterin-guanine dinucleotide biosynthesis protein B [Myxococcales bacterium]|nr:molybdopterin-guanine dinucleotide biosynthesis protein B [Myxococcales bacterium]